ncbi:hypothetical protein ACFW2Y_10900 [Streptomyces sp. NPDC058877]|uniref:hypothetical protein n=1 Tax=Streptomyces sp. NPDC058877 TaxID=3346665 RepID=UPI00368D81E4
MRLYGQGDNGVVVDALHDLPVATPHSGCPASGPQFVLWHGRQVFKRPGAQAA